MASTRAKIIGFPVLAAVLGFLLGFLANLFMPWLGAKTTTQERVYPLPHHFPKHPGNISLRFAMVHDVIHERFPRHGPDYYRARNHSVAVALKKSIPAAKGKEADEHFRLWDDWCVGLAFLGQFSEAVESMREKLKRQQALGYEGKDLYSTYANLGTFLILWQLTEGVVDKAQAKKRIAESVQWIHKAIEVYPQSHFGREIWQAVLEEFLLAVLDNPELLLTFDMIGNRLDRTVDGAKASCFSRGYWLERFVEDDRIYGPFADQAVAYLKAPKPDVDTEPFRRAIEPVGAEHGWAALKTSRSEPTPFDEPTLGIVGMWRMGAGANPHFALALGEIMLRTGQRYIAWTAFERGLRLAEHFWPDPDIQQRFAAHCRARQKSIESELPDEDWRAARLRFEKELEFGKKYQKNYQVYEARRIAEGASLDDPTFYDAFNADHPAPATAVGKEDVAIVHQKLVRSGVRGLMPMGLLGAGLLGCSTAGLMWLKNRRWRSSGQDPGNEAVTPVRG